jgi:hypothetical protein
MPRPQAVSTLGATFGFLGGVLLAFAASSELSGLRLAVLALKAETSALVEAHRNPNSPLLNITGTEKHIDAGKRRNSTFTYSGIVFLALSLVLTVASFFL